MLLQAMEEQRVDFTATFRQLGEVWMVFIHFNLGVNDFFLINVLFKAATVNSSWYVIVYKHKGKSKYFDVTIFLILVSRHIQYSMQDLNLNICIEFWIMFVIFVFAYLIIFLIIY